MKAPVGSDELSSLNSRLFQTVEICNTNPRRLRLAAQIELEINTTTGSEHPFRSPACLIAPPPPDGPMARWPNRWLETARQLANSQSGKLENSIARSLPRRSLMSIFKSISCPLHSNLARQFQPSKPRAPPTLLTSLTRTILSSISLAIFRPTHLQPFARPNRVRSGCVRPPWTDSGTCTSLSLSLRHPGGPHTTGNRRLNVMRRT